MWGHQACSQHRHSQFEGAESTSTATSAPAQRAATEHAGMGPRSIAHGCLEMQACLGFVLIGFHFVLDQQPRLALARHGGGKPGRQAAGGAAAQGAACQVVWAARHIGRGEAAAGNHPLPFHYSLAVPLPPRQ